MRALLFRAAVGLALAMTSITSPAAAQGPADAGRSALLEELGGARLARHAATGQLRFVGGTSARPAATAAKLRGPATPRAAADRFMSRYGSLSGVREPARELRVSRTTTDRLGRTVVRYQQVHEGVPVMAGDLLVQVGRQNEIISANGEASITAAVDTRPKVIPAAATRTAMATIAKSSGLAAADLSAGTPALWIHDPALLGGRGLPITRLVWRIDVTGGDLRELVVVDAQRGNVVLHFDQNADARNRTVCNANNTATQYPCTAPVRTEGSPPTGIPDVDNAYTYTGHTYDFFFNRFGRDSLDGAGMPLKSTVRYCPSGGPCPYVNAFWDGSQMVYGAGMASDDVVGHELSHGVTDFSSHLYYYMQSGAINEAISDVFGELMDLTNGTDGAGGSSAGARWLLGEDLSIGAIRDMEDPPVHGQPDRMKSSLYEDDPFFNDQGGVHTNSGVANKAAFLMVDGGTFNGRAVSAIGIDKTADVWYRVETQLLSSGSDYQDLGSYLDQACTDLVGSSVKNSAGTVTGSVASTDCAQVAKAVLATEMAQQPNVAQAPDAPVCTTGTPTNVVYDQIASGAPGWTAAGGDATADPAYGWFYGDWYATSNPYHLYGYGDSNLGSGTDATMTRNSANVIPANAFLHFRHAFDTEEGYDGGVVEYQVGAGPWTAAGPLFDTNGYNGTVGAPINGGAFTGFSYGYISSRANLSSLAGQTVRFRLRVVAD
jgi:Zn-dependent metalloprotease